MTKRAKREDVVVVCARITTPLMIPDNRIGKCSECGWKVQFRPHAPAGRRMCSKCAFELIDWSDPANNVEIPPRMVEDVASYFMRKRQ
jgi:hypothetical protein